MMGKPMGKLRPSALALLMAGVALPALAQELPTGGVVTSGDVTIQTAPGQMVIGQTSQYGIIDWTSFGVGAGAGVQFANGTGATLNRVTGGEASAILGSLDATGSVYLINPAGVVIGPNGVVQTGGRFVASTLDVTDADFLDGGALTFQGTGGVVLNLGAVGSSGGDVALIAGDVVNKGSLTAPNGTVGLAAGRQVVLRDAAVDDGLISVVVGGGDVTDQGAIKAAAAELRARGGNVNALAGNTDAVIEATGVEKVKGRVFLTAPGGKVTAAKAVSADDRIVATGQNIDLSGSLTGAKSIIVKAEDETDFTGMIQSDENGFVELSGGHLSFGGTVDQGGGTLLIDPRNIEISNENGSFLDDSTVFTTFDIATLLSTGSLILDTSTNDNGAAGTIAILSDMNLETANSLTLLAAGDIWVLANVRNDGSGDLNAVAGWDGTTAFNAGAFTSANLSATSLFGQASGQGYTLYAVDRTTSGTVYIGASDQVFGAAFGSRDGATRVYGRDVKLQGGMASEFISVAPRAQIGFSMQGNGDFGAATGAITVRATDSVSLLGGTTSDAYALIGHGGSALAGDSSTPTAALSGAILVEAGQNVTLAGVSDPDAQNGYAMIGHGSADYNAWMTEGDRTGSITLTLGGELSIVNGGNFSSQALIGHHSGFGTISGAPVTVTAARADLSLDAADSSLIDLGMWALDTDSGEVRLTLTQGDLTVQGNTSFLDNESLSITTDYDLILQASGRMTLGEDFHYGNAGAGGLVLAAERFANLAAEPFLDIGGGWFIYSTRPDNDQGLLGTITPSLLAYGTTYDPGNPHGGQEGGLLAYSVTPVVQTPNVTIPFGTATVPVTSRLTVDGVEVDAAAFGFTLTPLVDYEGLVLTEDELITAGLWTNALYAAVETSVPTTGYTTQRGNLLVTGGNSPAKPPEVAPTPASFSDEPLVDPEPPALRGALEVIDTESTGRILEDIRAGTDFCRQFVDPEYAIDCLSDRLQSVADGLSATGEYAEVRAALEDAAANLHDLALRNAADELSRSIARATDGSGRTSGRPLTAIDPAKLEAANAEAAAIIANTQLVLLRSGAESERRKVAFQQVGQVLGQTVVLLRS